MMSKEPPIAMNSSYKMLTDSPRSTTTVKRSFRDRYDFAANHTTYFGRLEIKSKSFA